MPQDDLDLIIPEFGNTTINLGFASIPKIFLRFAKFLTHNGLRLNDSDMYLIALVLMLRSDADYKLRVSNLPLQTSARSREDLKQKLRKMGLIFTSRDYYGKAIKGVPPRMKGQVWDFRSLFHNLERVANIWLENQRVLVAKWKAAGSKGRKPVYEFPEDFSLEIELPPDVARDILAGAYFPKPADAWLAATQTMDLPTHVQSVGRQENSPPTHVQSVGHLYLNQPEEEDEEERAAQLGQIWSLFAQYKGMSEYHPTEKEVSHLTKLLADGYTLQDIRQAMAEGFSRKNPPNNFALVARIARDNRPHAARMPEAEPEEVVLLPETEREIESAPAPETHEPIPPEVPFGAIWRFYAQAKGVADYTPTPAEEKHLTRLIADGYTFDAICDAIEDAFNRPRPPESFVLVAMIARDASPAAEIPPELRPHTDLLAKAGYGVNAGTLSSLTDLLHLCQPDTAHDWLQAALREAILHQANNPLAYVRKTLQDWLANGRPSPPTAPDALIVDADLTEPARILALANIDLTERVHAQLRLVADGCQAAALRAGESGAIWLSAALTQGLNKHSPLEYAAAVLANWRKNGRPQPKPAPANAQPRPGMPRNGRTPTTKAERSLMGVLEAESLVRGMRRP